MNIVKANLSRLRTTITGSLYQYDYGQKLQIIGLKLPQSFEVHFALKTGGTTMTVLGTDNAVYIPDELLQTKGDITAYIYLHTGEEDGETEYKIRIPVIERPQPSDYEPTPVQQDVITQTIAALNTAVGHVDKVAENLETEIVTAVQTELDTGKYNGKGVPTGGTERQVLMKASDDDYDTEWVTGGAGVTDYADLENKPQINSVELNGNKSLADLGIVIPVQSVNSKTGNVVLNASDVGAVSTEVDPTVPSWAKQSSKPTYTASEVGALPDTYTAPVSSVNTKTGAVVLTASDVGALPSTTAIPTNTSDLTNDSGFLSSAVTTFNGQSGAVTYTAPVSSVNGQTGAVVIGNATTSNAGLMSAQDKTDLGTLMADYSSALTALGVI